MAKYRLRRKTYGVVEATGNVLGNTVGGVTEAAGKAMDTKLGGLAGGLAGMSFLGSTLASAGLGPVGWLAAGALGATMTRGLGKGLKSAGQDMQS